MATDAEADDVAPTEDDTSMEFAWNWGGGLKTALADRIGLRADLRYLNGDELPRTIAGCTGAWSFDVSAGEAAARAH